MPELTVIILTYNEALHIRRCIRSALRVAKRVIVVDSGSMDSTVTTAKSLGVTVLSNLWVNHATQFNWALDHAPIETDWVMRLDADEYLDERLIREIKRHIVQAPDAVTGFVVKRIVVFQGTTIRFGGGVSPGRALRLWRRGKARCEQRWMDEHMVLLSGRAQVLGGVLYDHNLKTLTWWLEKHNHYANREAVDLLNKMYSFLPGESVPTGLLWTARTKRLIKNNIYRRLPSGLRAALYFMYRITFRLGLLDGKGMQFHFLQAFWYRVIVDMKVAETERYMRAQKVDAPIAIREILGIEVGEKLGTSDKLRSRRARPE